MILFYEDLHICIFENSFKHCGDDAQYYYWQSFMDTTFQYYIVPLAPPPWGYLPFPIR